MPGKILVADIPETEGRLRAALAGHALQFVRTFEQATAALAAEDHALLVIDAHFADAKMFELLRAARARNRALPILCVRARMGFAAITSEALEVTVKALNADAFLDLRKFPQIEAGNLALGRVVYDLLRRRIA